VCLPEKECQLWLLNVTVHVVALMQGFGGETWENERIILKWAGRAWMSLMWLRIGICGRVP
jgi:hypothetical protein